MRIFSQLLRSVSTKPLKYVPKMYGNTTSSDKGKGRISYHTSVISYHKTRQTQERDTPPTKKGPDNNTSTILLSYVSLCILPHLGDAFFLEHARLPLQDDIDVHILELPGDARKANPECQDTDPSCTTTAAVTILDKCITANASAANPCPVQIFHQRSKRGSSRPLSFRLGV